MHLYFFLNGYAMKLWGIRSTMASDHIALIYCGNSLNDKETVWASSEIYSA